MHKITVKTEVFKSLVTETHIYAKIFFVRNMNLHIRIYLPVHVYIITTVFHVYEIQKCSAI